MGSIDFLYEKDYQDALVIVVDTANRVRIEGSIFEKAKEVIKIDHHPDIEDERYGVINYVDTQYSSTCELLYYLFDTNVIIVRILKALYSAYTCVLIYKLTTRNFNESTARIAGVIAMLFPNLIYYCGLHLKETEMVFLTVLLLERADFAIRNKKNT